ncbi:family 20 glycosylhydrolase [Phyllobacterium sp. SYP-B3895]|uniref:glycoside hydrolase family 20 zincin-like fold domain-containing protein n=1 Tax=Phyllobacterium sp. SYP-B3895 TaxID=2663240 RepID=UPI001299678D|nr:glycoside hydrolase family 20 zincin-like fold domain-containing protein [Phyllobacterium sp. SYP-B3895]MRG56536.1 family 20 glycosylhydrolase [Phyllobacterium sp. SYP-B3895]
MKVTVQLLATLLLPMVVAGCNNDSSDGPTGDPAPTFITEPNPPIAPPELEPRWDTEPEVVPSKTSKHCVDPELDDQQAINASINSSNGTLPASVAQLLPVPAYASSASAGTSLDARTLIAVDKSYPGLQPVVAYLRSTLKQSTGYELPINPGIVDSAVISAPPCIKLEIRALKASNGQSIGAEGYSLTTTAKGVAIRAPSPKGSFNGVETLLQLLPPKVYSAPKQPLSSDDIVHSIWNVPAIQIVDWPRFSYRGMRIDLEKGAFGTADIKRLIDEMSRLKMNTLHLRLTAEQVSAMLSNGQAVIGSETQWYKQESVKDLIAYASDHLINVVPNVDVSNLTTLCGSHCAGASLEESVNSVITGMVAVTPGQYFDISIGYEAKLPPEDFKRRIEILPPLRCARPGKHSWSGVRWAIIPFLQERPCNIGALSRLEPTAMLLGYLMRKSKQSTTV